VCTKEYLLHAFCRIFGVLFFVLFFTTYPNKSCLLSYCIRHFLHFFFAFRTLYRRYYRILGKKEIAWVRKSTLLVVNLGLDRSASRVSFVFLLFFSFAWGITIIVTAIYFSFVRLGMRATKRKKKLCPVYTTHTDIHTYI